MKTIYKILIFQILHAVFWYLIVSLIGNSIYYDEWNNIAKFLSIPLEIGYLIQFGQMLNKHIL